MVGSQNYGALPQVKMLIYILRHQSCLVTDSRVRSNLRQEFDLMRNLPQT